MAKLKTLTFYVAEGRSDKYRVVAKTKKEVEYWMHETMMCYRPSNPCYGKIQKKTVKYRTNWELFQAGVYAPDVYRVKPA